MASVLDSVGLGWGRSRARRSRSGWSLAAALGLVMVAMLAPSCTGLRSGRGLAPIASELRGEPMVRVRVVRQQESVSTEGNTKVLVRPIGMAPGSDGAATASAAPGGGERAGALLGTIMVGPVTVTASSSGVAVRDKAGKSVVLAAALLTSAEPGTGATERTVRIGGLDLPGSVFVLPSTTQGRVDVVVHVPMEQYLVGVLAKELIKGWPIETFRAQAVASRSYALHEMLRRREHASTFDLEGDQLDQVYGGNMIWPEAAEAVRDTRGMVMTHKRDVVRAYFSSTCGGRSSSAAEVWPATNGLEFNGQRPLQGRVRPFACESSKYFRWQAVRSRSDVEGRLRLWGAANQHGLAKLGELAGIEPKRVGENGRPGSYTIRQKKGPSFVLRAEDLRVALNTAGEGFGKPDADKLVRSGDMELELAGNAAVLRGRGWGHGVGMCQFCARGFAEQGMDHAHMLALFYPGSRLQRAF